MFDNYMLIINAGLVGLFFLLFNRDFCIQLIFLDLSFLLNRRIAAFIQSVIAFFENRFTGVYFNPNWLGFASVVSVVCCHFLSKPTMQNVRPRRIIGRGFLLTCAVINLFALILSDSNAAFVLMLGYVIVYVAYIFFDTRAGMSPSKVFIRIVTLIMVVAVFIGSSVIFRTVFKAGFAAVTSKTNALVDVLFDDEKLINEIAEGEAMDKASEQAVTFNHENTNIDSGRFRLWRESLDLFKISPIIGIANGNIVFYSEEYLNGELTFSYHNSDLHNGFLTILGWELCCSAPSASASRSMPHSTCFCGERQSATRSIRACSRFCRLIWSIRCSRGRCSTTYPFW